MNLVTPQLIEALRSSPYAWWEWDCQTNIVTFNDLKASMLGYDPEALRGRGYLAFTALLHPVDYDATMAAMMRVLEGTTDLYQIDYRIRAADGSYHWFMDRGLALDRHAGRPTVIRGLVIDLGQEAQITGSVEAVLEIARNSLATGPKGVESSLVVCSSCQRVKQNRRQFVPLSPELHHLLGTQLSHGICPDCIRALYPEYADRILAGDRN